MDFGFGDLMEHMRHDKVGIEGVLRQLRAKMRARLSKPRGMHEDRETFDSRPTLDIQGTHVHRHLHFIYQEPPSRHLKFSDVPREHKTSCDPSPLPSAALDTCDCNRPQVCNGHMPETGIATVHSSGSKTNNFTTSRAFFDFEDSC
jgi:hypothetical protein